MGVKSVFIVNSTSNLELTKNKNQEQLSALQVAIKSQHTHPTTHENSVSTTMSSQITTPPQPVKTQTTFLTLPHELRQAILLESYGPPNPNFFRAFVMGEVVFCPYEWTASLKAVDTALLGDVEFIHEKWQVSCKKAYDTRFLRRLQEKAAKRWLETEAEKQRA